MKTILLMAVTAGSAAANPIPYGDGDGLSAWLFIKVMLITVALLATTYALLLLLRKKNLLPAQGKAARGVLEVVDRCRLGPRTTLYLVRNGSELVLITDSNQHVSTVVSTCPVDAILKKPGE